MWFFKKWSHNSMFKRNRNTSLAKMFIKTKRTGPTIENTSSSNLVGKTSKVQFVVFMCLTTSVRDEREMGTKWSNTDDCGVVADWSGLMLPLLSALTDTTLSTKKCNMS